MHRFFEVVLATVLEFVHFILTLAHVIVILCQAVLNSTGF